MKRPVVKFTALAVVIYLAGLVALFPASLALRWFLPETPGLELGAADGTVWRGRVAGIEYRNWSLGAAEWSVDPLALLGLAIAADVQLERPGRGPVTTHVRMSSSGRIAFDSLRGAVTLGDLARAKLLPANVASGEIILNLERLELVNGRPVAADGTAGLTGLRSALLPNVALGSYEGVLQTTGTGIDATFRELEAPLDVSGQAQVQPDGSYTVSGSMTPTQETPESVRRGLMLLGQPDASGRYEFGFSGSL